MADVSIDEFTELILAVFRLNGRITDWGDRIGAQLGLSTTRWQILGAIRLASRPQTAPQIAHSMGLTRQGVQKQLNALLAAGFVVQQTNPLHERSHLYALTESGREVEAKAVAMYADWLQEAAGGLSGQQIEDAGEILKTMACNLERILYKK